MNRAFTLIEILIYITLSSIVFTSLMGSIYPMMRKSEEKKRAAYTLIEETFIRAKMRETLLNTKDIIVPEENTTRDSLAIKTHDGKMVTYAIDSSLFTVTRNGRTVPLTPSFLEVTDFVVTHTTTEYGRIIEATLTMDGASIMLIQHYVPY